MVSIFLQIYNGSPVQRLVTYLASAILYFTTYFPIMAFFGLTALGPHPFASLEESNPTLHLFTENDLEEAWKRSDGEGEITK